jgi:hypothetical protein
MAVDHSMLVTFYHRMQSGVTYPDLGGDFFDRLEPGLTGYYVKRLEGLAHKVRVETSVAA